MVLYPRVGTHRPRRTSAHVSRKVRALIWIREFLKAPDIPPKMLARERNLTKYSHGDIVDDIGLAETVLIMLKLRDDPHGREMASYLQWLLLKTETRERRGSLGRFVIRFPRITLRAIVEEGPR